MRPLRLEIEGFTAFKSAVVLDLSELDLFAVTGPTGAGKSSIIDAVSYALYGRVPRVGNDTKDCISQGLPRMLVTMEFLAGEERYRVFRETRRQGQGNVRLERCEAGQWIALTQGATEVTRRIESVLGLLYEAFTRSVLLPQGQFQEFLAGSPSQRRTVLESLLRLDVYSRMRTRANEIATEHKRQIESIEKTLTEVFAEATPENLERQQDELEVRRAEASTLVSSLGLWKRALKLADAAGACEGVFQAAAAARDAAAAAVAAAEGLAEEGDTILAKLSDAAAGLEGQIAANTFDADLFAALTSGANLALTAETSLRKYREAAATAKARAAALVESEGLALSAGAALGGRASVFNDAQHALMLAQRSNQAASIQRTLAVGDECPVCGSPVSSLQTIEAADLDEATSDCESANEGLEAARRAESAAAVRLVSSQTSLEGATQALAQAKAQAQQDRTRLQEALPDVADRSATALQAALRDQKDARDQRASLVQRHKEALTVLTQHQQSVAAARAELAAKQQLHRAQTDAADAARASFEQAAAALEAYAADGPLPAVARAAGARDAAATCESEIEALSKRNETVQQDIGRLVNLVDRLADDIQKRRQFEAQAEAIRPQHAVAADLAQMLMANRFGAYVQSEAMRVLATEGSEKLHRLSGGRYLLGISETGADFEAIDQWNLDERRSVRTLSGGETFLASLALSLALAETLSGLAAGRRVTLDAIFLDEGFGSLDREALDRAAEALDSLRDGKRMVCVVTHLEELAQRMPARIVVEKSETAGSRAYVA